MSQVRNRILCALVLAAVLCVYIWTNDKLAFLFLLLLCILLACSVGGCLLAGRLVTAQVQLLPDRKRGALQGSARDPEELDEGRGRLMITLRNPLPLPVVSVNLEIMLRNLLTGSGAPLRRSYFLLPRQRWQEEIPLDSLYVGRVEADIMQAECRDAFGIFCCRIAAVSRGRWDQYPELAPMGEELHWERDPSLRSMDRYLHRRGNDPSEILDIREYQRGDSVKRIHWKLTARLGKTMMRELDMPSEQDTLLVMAVQEGVPEETAQNRTENGAQSPPGGEMQSQPETDAQSSPKEEMQNLPENKAQSSPKEELQNQPEPAPSPKDPPARGEAIHRVVSYGLNLSWNLLQQEVHHNVLLLDPEGQVLQNVSVASGEDYHYLEQRMVEGGISLRADHLEEQLEEQQLTGKYSQVLYVTDGRPARDLAAQNVVYLQPHR